MIRIATETGYTLVPHQEHARLAGRFAAHWGNDVFPAPAAPEVMPHVLAAVARHDDAWAVRDAAPFLTREGRPSAFTRELVGTYSAFEEIDLADYLAVRGAATEAVAAEDPFAAILVYAQELMPGRVGTVAGLFFGLAFGLGGIGAAVLGELADLTGIEFVYELCAFLPALGLVTILLPDIEGKRPRSASAGE